VATISKRVASDGTVSFRVQVRMKGHPPLSSTFQKKTDAQKWGADREAEIRQGQTFPYMTSRRYTVADMIDRYIEEVLPRKPLSVVTQGGQLKRWRQMMGAYRLSEVQPSLITDVRKKLMTTPVRGKAGISSSSANRYMAVLSHAFTIAKKEWGWIDRNPLSDIERLPENPGRTRSLSTIELEAFLKACRSSDLDVLYPFVVLAISTGLRKSNLLNLQWSDVDLEKGSGVVVRTKNGDPIRVRISGHPLVVLQEMAKHQNFERPWIFLGPKRRGPAEIRYAFDKACKQANISDFRIHDLRHCAASYLAMSGATLRDLSDFLGHRTLEQVKRYSHLTEEHTSKVVDRMTSHIFKGLPDGE
jgi:integrase